MRGEAVRVSDSELLPNLIKSEKNFEVKMRLSFLHVLSSSKLSFDNCCLSFGIGHSTAYAWIQKWNSDKYSGIKQSDNTGGRPPKLSPEELKTLKSLLLIKDHWSTKEIIDLIKEKFDITLSHDRISPILKKISE